MEKSIVFEEIFEIENRCLEKGCSFVVGVDEAGRGPLVGPVVAGAVMIRGVDKERLQEKAILEDFGEDIFDLIKDSKKLTPKRRDLVYDFILSNFYVGIGVCDHNTVDRVNILEASFLAMKKAISDLKMKNKDVVSWGDEKIFLIDGNKTIPNLSDNQEAFVGGDNLVKLISAASIVAKVHRDRMMEKMHEKYPQYGFDKHKGYGTKAHMEALEKFGPCEFHRKSFGPVKRLLG
ncbi:MAG: ribonuclease HII [Candidatus Moranbacteria bacterium]|nr:ribonuclease HII [Candidatus Moranbacteria bacterium]